MAANKTLGINQEDFDAWREHPVTCAVMAYLEARANETEATWKEMCWNNAVHAADMHFWHQQRERCEALNELLNLGFVQLADGNE